MQEITGFFEKFDNFPIFIIDNFHFLSIDILKKNENFLKFSFKNKSEKIFFKSREIQKCEISENTMKLYYSKNVDNYYNTPPENFNVEFFAILEVDEKCRRYIDRFLWSNKFFIVQPRDKRYERYFSYSEVIKYFQNMIDLIEKYNLEKTHESSFFMSNVSIKHYNQLFGIYKPFIILLDFLNDENTYEKFKNRTKKVEFKEQIEFL